MERKTVAIILAVITAVFVVVCFFVLPDNVALQIGSDGKPTVYAPKALAILVPTVLSAAGTFFYYRSENGILISYIILACAGFLVYGFLVAINCLRF